MTALPLVYSVQPCPPSLLSAQPPRNSLRCPGRQPGSPCWNYPHFRCKARVLGAHGGLLGTCALGPPRVCISLPTQFLPHAQQWGLTGLVDPQTRGVCRQERVITGCTVLSQGAGRR